MDKLLEAYDLLKTAEEEMKLGHRKMADQILLEAWYLLGELRW